MEDRDLSGKEVTSPAWHGDVLAERDRGTGGQELGGSVHILAVFCGSAGVTSSAGAVGVFGEGAIGNWGSEELGVSVHILAVSGGSAGMTGGAEAARVFGEGVIVANRHSSREVKSAAGLGRLQDPATPCGASRVPGNSICCSNSLPEKLASIAGPV